MSSAKRIVILDSLRGIAALVVVFHHLFVFNYKAWVAKLEPIPWLLDLVRWISDRNHEAVLFFFILSGFVIYLSTRKLDFTKREDLNYYLFRRFRRILPLYWLTLGITFVLGYFSYGWEEPSFSWWSFLGNLFFLQTSPKVGEYWVAPYGVNGPLWSLAYEMFFYLFFPLYWLACQKLSSWLKASWASLNPYTLGFIGALGLAIFAIGIRSIFFTPFFSFLALFIIWYSGYFLAYLYKQQKTADPFILILTLAMFGFQIVDALVGSDTLGSIANAWLLFLPMYLYYRTYEWSARKTRTFKKILNRLFVRVGDGSYAIYLLHYPLLALLTRAIEAPFWLEVLLLILWCWVAILLENWINKQPWNFFKRKYV